jgi:mRNA-degrading endonuclease YafQ of YafQ-DinJ toxin-antitoxin module
LARELIILPRFKRDYRTARKHPEFEAETLEYVFDLMIFGGKLPEAFREHRLDKRGVNWAGFTECHLGADLLPSSSRRSHPSSNWISQAIVRREGIS